MAKQSYVDLIKKQEKELNDFPIAYAFNEEQLKEALIKLGANDISECVTIAGHGDIVKKENAKLFINMLKCHKEELHKALEDKEFAYEAFLYEMDNHEYAINWSGDDDVLDCFSLTFDELKQKGLIDIYNEARRSHYKHAEEWGII